MLRPEVLICEHPGRELDALLDLPGDVADPGTESTLTHRETSEQRVHDEEDRHLGQQGETAPERVDLVLPVELHQLGVELLPVVLVLGLEPLHLRLEALHLQHRTSALDVEWGDQRHHQDGEQHDRQPVVGDQRVEEVEDAAQRLEELLEHQASSAVVPSVIGSCPPIADRCDDPWVSAARRRLGSGTGSYPEVPHGWQRPSRRNANHDPRSAP